MSKIGKRAILILLALPIGFNVMAQEIKKLTLEDLIPGGETYRYAENLYGLQWWGDVCIKPSTDTIYTVQESCLSLSDDTSFSRYSIRFLTHQMIRSQNATLYCLSIS